MTPDSQRRVDSAVTESQKCDLKADSFNEAISARAGECLDGPTDAGATETVEQRVLRSVSTRRRAVTYGDDFSFACRAPRARIGRSTAPPAVCALTRPSAAARPRQHPSQSPQHHPLAARSSSRVSGADRHRSSTNKNFCAVVFV